MKSILLSMVAGIAVIGGLSQAQASNTAECSQTDNATVRSQFICCTHEDWLTPLWVNKQKASRCDRVAAYSNGHHCNKATELYHGTNNTKISLKEFCEFSYGNAVEYKFYY